jgi:glycosyltransferase involved in cell wall biosynthesis
MIAPSSPFDLAVAITAHNSIRTLQRTLESVQSLARTIIIVDSGSTDGTIELCERFNTTITHRPFTNIVDQKTFAVEQCKTHRWVLLLDSDESLEPPLQQSIRTVLSQDDPAYNGWSFNRKTWFLGAWLHHAYQPEWRTRLFRPAHATIVGKGADGLGGHDRVEVRGTVGRLTGDCRHDSWADFHDMALRQLRYAKRAGEHDPSGGGLFDLFIRPPAAFIKQFLIKRAFLDGWRGMVVSCMAYNQTLLKHLFIAVRKHHRP